MPDKRKNRKGKTQRRRRSSRHRITRKQRRGIYMRGGNYGKDITRRTLQGFPMKSYNEVVTTMPGYGTMSVSAYLKLQEDLDRNGKHYYD
jgi:hypothetical protein